MIRDPEFLADDTSLLTRVLHAEMELHEWLSKNTQGRWNYYPLFTEDYCPFYVWFEKPIDLIHFKLRFDTVSVD